MRLLLLPLLFLSTVFGIELTFNQPYTYKERLIKLQRTVPINPLIPQVKGYIVTVSNYKNYDQLKLRYIKNNKRQKKTYSGKYWRISQKSLAKYSKEKKKLIRQEMFATMQQHLKNKGVTIYPAIHAKHDFIFHKDNYWGHFAGYGDSITMKVVELSNFQQKLVIDPDELMKELNTTGEVRLEGIYFDTNKASLKKESTQALLAAAALLKKYPTLTLEIQGHTDDVGSEKSNQVLSEKRAQSVKKALIEQGIKSDRLSAKGFGESAPVATNKTKEGRAQNRRVILKKLGGGDHKALFSIKFIKPLPGFEIEKTRSSENGKLIIKFNQNGKDERKTFKGKLIWTNYRLIDKKYRGYSDLEILKNYENVLESFGCTIVGKKYKGDQQIYFYLKDRGDGKKIYGSVWATNDSYKVSFHLSNK